MYDLNNYMHNMCVVVNVLMFIFNSDCPGVYMLSCVYVIMCICYNLMMYRCLYRNICSLPFDMSTPFCKH